MDLIEDLTKDSERILEREIEEIHHLTNGMREILLDLDRALKAKGQESPVERQLQQTDQVEKQKIDDAREKHRQRLAALLEWARSRGTQSGESRQSAP